VSSWHPHAQAAAAGGQRKVAVGNQPLPGLTYRTTGIALLLVPFLVARIDEAKRLGGALRSMAMRPSTLS
jgi:hypothetical protein